MKKLIFTLLALASSGLLASAQTLAAYQATVNSQNPNYYFTFDGGSLISGGAHAPVTLAAEANGSVVSGSMYPQIAPDVFGNPTNAVYFSATADTLVDPNEPADLIINSGGGGAASTNSTASGSITFLFKSLDPGIYTAQKYIFCGGYTAADRNMMSLYFENTNVANGDPQSLKLRFGDRDVTILQASNVVPDTWYYFAFTYTEATNGYFFDSTGTNLVTIKGKWYLGIPGGTLASGVTTNAIDAVAGNGTFYIGNRDTQTEAFRNPGTGEVDEFATWTRRLNDAEVQAQFANLPNVSPPPRAPYEGLISSQSPSYYFKFDGNFVDSVGGTLALQTNLGPSSTMGFTYDYFGGPTNCVNFTVGGDAVTNGGNLLNGGGTYSPTIPGIGKGAISFLFRTLNSYVNQGNRYLYMAGGSPGTSNRFELYFNTYSSSADPDALKLGFGDNSTIILTTNNFVPASWYYFAMTYDETQPSNQVNWWLGQLGGPSPTLTSGTLSAISNSLAGEGDVFIIGDSTNLTANSFRNSTPSGQGRIEDFAIWHGLLTGTQITNQFNALFSSSVPAPTLSIVISGSNAVISWPSSTDPGYTLETNANLTTANWASEGVRPVTIGNQYVVTNAISSSATFYRLVK